MLSFVALWLLLIQLDAIRNLRIVSVFHRSPTYWKTTVIRIVAAVILQACFWHTFTRREHFLTGICQLFVYALPFDLSMSLARIEKAPIMYMGTKSLPERLLAGKHIIYLFLKFMLFVTGLMVLYY